MYPFLWGEIILYVLPIISLVLVNKYGRAYLNDGRYIKLAVVDVLHPILWICLHYMSLYTFYFSFVPSAAVVFCVVAIILLLIQFRDGKPFIIQKFFRRLSNITFIYVFLGYYLVVLVRILRLAVR